MLSLDPVYKEEKALLINILKVMCMCVWVCVCVERAKNELR